MLKGIRLSNVGPVPNIDIEFASRLNLITGDNGLGKSFLLDICWWALTRRWPQEVNIDLTSGFPARPTDPKTPATIGFTVDGKTSADLSYESIFNARDESWQGKQGRPPSPGLVIYAHADGGFSVWDPARNYWIKKGNLDTQDRIPAFVFSPRNLWDGLVFPVSGRDTIVCNGLIHDWAGWIKEKGENAERMRELLKNLVPGNDQLQVEGVTRLSLTDARDIPAVVPPYGGRIPILHASAGVRRAVGLAYMLVWAWTEHEKAAQLLGENTTNQVVLLFDEIESHLHPRWQRTILRSLLDGSKTLHTGAEVQLLAATHSPLVLASAEPFFNADRDAWFDFDLEATTVTLQKRAFERKGEVSQWLTSEAFDLREARSLEAEEAISAALSLLQETSPDGARVQKVTEQLRATLSDIDRFWVRWSEYASLQQSPQLPST
jgi:hypothetical protein